MIRAFRVVGVVGVVRAIRAIRVIKVSTGLDALLFVLCVAISPSALQHMGLATDLGLVIRTSASSIF